MTTIEFTAGQDPLNLDFFIEAAFYDASQAFKFRLDVANSTYRQAIRESYNSPNSFFQDTFGGVDEKSPRVYRLKMANFERTHPAIKFWQIMQSRLEGFMNEKGMQFGRNQIERIWRKRFIGIDNESKGMASLLTEFAKWSPDEK